ncbi:ATPase domain-containing protein [Acuticoccus kandeliae]|uniref:ATPase domain-containing protein n=1 Tax=Acuticoccus kandeliae TaxID=2073160 RepID=UPI000D3E5CF3|nr:ATPase domain-containing protein [Acuticoccus kandeliae]
MSGTLDRVPSGIPGLDAVLGGGVPAGRMILVEGTPGTGKTTLGLQFLLAGAARGERALFFSIAQSASELTMIAASHDMDLSTIEVVSPEVGAEEEERTFSVETDEAQLVALMREIARTLETSRPDLLVFDSMLELQLLAGSAISYRRELLTLRRQLREAKVTSLILDHFDVEGREGYAEGVAHGVIRLVADTPTIGITHRRLTVVKMRGAPFREGFHDFRIRTGGLEVYPRIVPSDTLTEPATRRQLIPSQPALRDMLGGGLEFGTTTLVAGQAGTGKSTLSTVFAIAGAEGGEKTALFLFEERPEVFRARSESVGLDLAPFEANGAITIRHFDPAEISPGEFSRAAVRAVEEGASVIIIDSLSGYVNALPNRANVLTHLHALLQHLSRRGILVVVTLAQHGLLGEPPRSDIDTSYIADAIILLRQFAEGTEVRRTIAVLKKRYSQHERGIQELVIREGAVEVQIMTRPG